MAAATGGFMSLGVIEASEKFNLGTNQTASFCNETVDDTSVLVKYTYGGDADLDGMITTGDYFAIDSGFANAARMWIGGDYDLNGVINGDDYFWIDSNYVDQSVVY
jgi:hypothetical protein